MSDPTGAELVAIWKACQVFLSSHWFKLLIFLSKQMSRTATPFARYTIGISVLHLENRITKLTSLLNRALVEIMVCCMLQIRYRVTVCFVLASALFMVHCI
ncbi:hypothetical protein GQ457_18G023280 [Hibiscus cannabinus]